MKSQNDNFFYEVHDLSRKMRRWIEGFLTTPGLTMPQFRAIAQLCKNDGISQTSLAGLIESDPMTVGGVVERLESKGLITRQPHPEDSRAKLLTVTDAGRAIYDELVALVHAANKDMFDGITPEEQRLTLDVMRRVGANLSEVSVSTEDDKK